MTIFPFISNQKDEMSRTQYIMVIIVYYISILIYVAAFFLTILNIWQILIKQEKWKTMPLLVFYIYSFMAISIRLVNEFMFGLESLYNWQILLLHL